MARDNRGKAADPGTERVRVHKTVITTDHKVFFKGEVQVEPDLARRIREAHRKPEPFAVDGGGPPEEAQPEAEAETREEMEARVRAEVEAELRAEQGKAPGEAAKAAPGKSEA